MDFVCVHSPYLCLSLSLMFCVSVSLYPSLSLYPSISLSLFPLSVSYRSDESGYWVQGSQPTPEDLHASRERKKERDTHIDRERETGTEK